MDFLTFAAEEAKRQGVDPALVLSVLAQESGGDQSTISKKGAAGLMQLMPDTARELGVNPADPYDNIRGGVKYLRQQIDTFQDPGLALAAYNAGPGAVKRHGGVPPYAETQNYVRQVMGRAGDGDIFGAAARKPAARDDSDIFGAPVAPQKGAQDDSDIFGTAPPKPASSALASEPVKPQQADPVGSGVAANIAAGPNEVIANTVGAPVDAMSWLLGKMGAPTSDAPVLGSEWLKRRMGDLGFDPRDVKAVTSGEKLARGASRGAAEAASVFMPATVVSRASQAGGMARGIADALASQQATQAAAGAVGGATTEATDNPWLGAAAGMATPLAAAGATRLVSPIRSQLTPEQARLAEAASREGINLTAAQETGSRPLKTMESVFGTLPLTAGPQRAIEQAQREQFNRAVLSRAGIDANYASPEVLDAARQRIGDRFNSLVAKTGVGLDQQFSNDIKTTTDALEKGLPSHERHIAHEAIDYLKGLGPSIDGATYQQLRSDLGAKERAYQASDSILARTFGKLQDALDEAAYRSAADKDAWTETRRQWAHLDTIRKSMNTTQDAVAGNVPPSALSNAVRNANKNLYPLGIGDLNDLSRVGTAFVRQQVPNSGTPERNMITGLLTGGPVGAAGGAIAMGADPVLSLAAGAGGLLAPRAIQAVYNSAPMQAYLRNRVAAQAGPTVNKALIASMLSPRLPGLLN